MKENNPLKLHEVIVVTKSGAKQVKIDKVIPEPEIIEYADKMEREHPEYPDAICHAHYGEFKQ